MAERRMFAKTIIDSDAFLDMPLCTQSLYFHLSMRADDDGFINNSKKIQRMIGASDDDFKLLVAKRFIIPFESGIIVIKHWNIHNYIQSDRYRETVYLEEKSMLIKQDNKAYELLDTTCIQDVSKLDTQVRIDKDNKNNKNNILCVSDKSENAAPALASDVITYLNEKTGKKYSATSKPTVKLINARAEDGHVYEDFVKVIDNKVAAWGNDPKMAEYLRPSTLFAASHFEEYLNAVPAQKRSAARYQNPEQPSDDQWDALERELAIN